MATISQWVDRSWEKLASARILLGAGKYVDAVENCRFAVEIALKARIADLHGLPEVPKTAWEWKQKTKANYFTHNLDDLLIGSGQEQSLKLALFAEWSDVVRWEVDVRYEPAGSVSMMDADVTVGAANAILEFLWN